jgi:transcriptional regulator with AAA-type ATPase domain
MGQLTSEETIFCKHVTALSFCNQFSDERLPLMEAILGDEYLPAGNRWHWQWSASGIDDPNLERLAMLADNTLETICARLSGGTRLRGAEAQLYQGLLFWVSYHRSRDALLDVIKTQHETAGVVGCRRAYEKFSADYERFLTVVEPQDHGPPASHMFALYFQVRRAFYHIFYYMIGGSKVAGRLRTAVWESIFTHDRRRYMRALYSRMNLMPTLITGETGTGKELIARAIAFSRYVPYDEKAGAFAENFASAMHALNLTALSATLLESELFGHRRGSFTGATADRVGYLEDCTALGTVFLDEIGELDCQLQVKLLRVLEDRHFNRIGDVKPLKFKGKIIAATNRDLAAEIEAGEFRSDFYYRLCADQVRAPSLREQMRDAPEELKNAVLFIARREAGEDEAEQLANETMLFIEKELGLNYTWPGNFRELGQCVRNVLVRNDYRPLREAPKAPSEALTAGIRDGALTVADLLRHYVSRIHAETDNYQETARRLGIDHRTVRKHLDPEIVESCRKS